MNNPSFYKVQALNALKGNWKNTILITLVLVVVQAVNVTLSYMYMESYAVIQYLLSILGVVVGVWMILAYLDLYRGEKDWCKVEQKDSLGKFSLLAILYYIYIVLWTCLLIVPGIIKSFSYAMSFFILKDNPEISASEAIRRSQIMMKGHKFELFKLYLSFFGWMLLIILTLGILTFYVSPYMYTTFAAYYEDLKKESVASV